MTEVETAEAENKRLRAALKEVRAVALLDGLPQWVEFCDAALRARQPEGGGA